MQHYIAPTLIVALNVSLRDDITNAEIIMEMPGELSPSIFP